MKPAINYANVKLQVQLQRQREHEKRMVRKKKMEAFWNAVYLLATGIIIGVIMTMAFTANAY